MRAVNNSENRNFGKTVGSVAVVLHQLRCIVRNNIGITRQSVIPEINEKQQ